MTRFDRTEGSYIDQKIRDQLSLVQLGKVVNVYEHTEPDDASNFEVDVILRDEQTQRRGIPFSSVGGDAIHVPQEGDMVLVQFLDGDDERPIVTRTVYTDQRRPPLATEGTIRYKRGGLYFEMEPSGEWARIASKSSDDGEPDSVVEVDSAGDVTITGDRVQIDDAEQIVQLTTSADLGAGGANEHDLNQDGWTVMPWDTVEYDDEIYTYDGSEAITVGEDGTYELYVNIYHETVDNAKRLSFTTRFTNNGSPLDGKSGNGFISGTQGHQESSTNFQRVYQLNAGDTIRVETEREASSGEVYPVAEQTTFSVRKLLQ